MRKYEKGHTACEFKYDGARLQIHMPSITEWRKGDLSKATIFSRNMERINEKYQQVLNVLVDCSQPHVESFIIEGEMVAIDHTAPTPKLLPFQVLQTNGNKDMCCFAFDLLYLNGESYIHVSLPGLYISNVALIKT